MTDEQLVDALIDRLKEFEQRFTVNTKGPIEVAERLADAISSLVYRFARAESLYPGLTDRLRNAATALRTKSPKEST